MIVGSRRIGNVHIAILKIEAKKTCLLGKTFKVALDIIPGILRDQGVVAVESGQDCSGSAARELHHWKWWSCWMEDLVVCAQ